MRTIRLLFYCLLSAAAFCPVSIHAIPAYPYRIPVCVDGRDTVYIRLMGDEFFKHAETEDGYTIIHDGTCWFYAEKNDSGLLVASKHALTKHHDANTQTFLNTIPRHLYPDALPRYNHIRRAQTTHREQQATGERRILVILMQYSDLSFSKTADDFNALFNQQNYAADGAQGSVRDFYSDVSYGQLLLQCDVIGPFTSTYGYSHYGGNDTRGNDINPEGLFEEAIAYAANEYTLADYDGDGDGYIDNVHIIFAGYGEEAGASANAIWSHECTFWEPYEVQGLKVDRYSCAPELRGRTGKGISRIGPHCHEIGHALGAMDFYDTNYATGGEYEGTGLWDVMASGSWNNEGISPADFNPYVKAYNYGWISPAPLPAGAVVIPPSCEEQEGYYILASPDADDYYLLEYRSQAKWGTALPGSGLLLFHVHGDIADAENEINASYPQKCYVVCASSNTKKPGSTPGSYGNINTGGCPYPGRSGNTEFSSSSTPSAFFWNGSMCDINLSDISLEDGRILLVNNSNGIGGDGAQRRTLFKEDFESTPQIEIDESATAQWHVVENLDLVMKYPDRPRAYNGERCLQLSSSRKAAAVSSAYGFLLQGKDGQGKITLSFYYTSFNPQEDTPNNIKVGYQTDDNDGWQSAEVSSSNTEWAQARIELPANVLPRISIEGTVSPGSILAMDDIKVEQEVESEETGIQAESITAPSSQPVAYSITGRRLQHVQRGMNIVRMPDGSYRTIVIK